MLCDDCSPFTIQWEEFFTFKFSHIAWATNGAFWLADQLSTQPFLRGCGGDSISAEIGCAWQSHQIKTSTKFIITY